MAFVPNVELDALEAIVGPVGLEPTTYGLKIRKFFPLALFSANFGLDY